MVFQNINVSIKCLFIIPVCSQLISNWSAMPYNFVSSVESCMDFCNILILVNQNKAAKEIYTQVEDRNIIIIAFFQKWL